MSSVARSQEFLHKLSKIKCNATLQEAYALMSAINEYNRAESDDTAKFLTKTEKTLGKRKIKQLYAVKEACDNEVVYLFRNLNASTVSSTVTAYRNTIKNANDAHPALAFFRLTRDFYDNRSTEYTAKVKETVQRDLHDYERYLRVAINMLSSNSYMQVTLGLVALTGRRPSEILLTAKFEQVNHIDSAFLKEVSKDRLLTFTGQLKKREQENDGYTIPVLCDNRLVLEAIEKLRKMKDFSDVVPANGKTLAQMVNSKTAKEQNIVARKFFAEFVEGNQITAYSLRAIYASIASFLYYDSDCGNEMPFFSEILGHSKNDIATAHSYEKFRIA